MAFSSLPFPLWESLEGTAAPSSTTQSISGVANVQLKFSETKTVTGKASIKVSGKAHAVSGKAHVSVLGVVKSVSGKGRVSVTAVTQTVTGKGSVKLSGVLHTLSGKGSAQVTGKSHTIHGKGSVRVTGNTQTITGKAFVEIKIHQHISGVGHIAVTGVHKNIAGKGNIQTTAVKWIIGSYSETSDNFANQVKMLGGIDATSGTNAELTSTANDLTSQGSLGVIAVIVVNRQITDQASLDLAAAQELQKRAIPVQLTFDFEHDGLKAGMLVFINSPATGHVGSYIIQTLKMKIVGFGIVRYTATVGNYLGDLVNRLKTLSQQAPGTLIPPSVPVDNSIQSSQIASVAATTITGQIGDSQINGVSVSKLLSGAVVFTSEISMAVGSGGGFFAMDSSSVTLQVGSVVAVVSSGGFDVTGKISCTSSLTVGSGLIVSHGGITSSGSTGNTGSFTFCLDPTGPTFQTVNFVDGLWIS